MEDIKFIVTPDMPIRKIMGASKMGVDVYHAPPGIKPAVRAEEIISKGIAVARNWFTILKRWKATKQANPIIILTTLSSHSAKDYETSPDNLNGDEMALMAAIGMHYMRDYVYTSAYDYGFNQCIEVRFNRFTNDIELLHREFARKRTIELNHGPDSRSISFSREVPSRGDQKRILLGRGRVLAAFVWKNNKLEQTK